MKNLRELNGTSSLETQLKTPVESSLNIEVANQDTSNADIKLEQPVKFNLNTKQNEVLDATIEEAGDIFNIFPDELLFQILSGVEDSLEKLVQLALVSKRWRRIIYEVILKNVSDEKLLIIILMYHTVSREVWDQAFNSKRWQKIFNDEWPLALATIKNILKNISLQELVKLLEINCKNGSTDSNSILLKLIGKIENYKKRVVDPLYILLLDKRIINSRSYDHNYNTLLHCACSLPEENFELVEFLLAHGADPMLQNLLGYIPLHIAYMFGHTKVSDLLLAYGPSNQKDVVNITGETPREIEDSFYIENFKKKLKIAIKTGKLERAKQIFKESIDRKYEINPLIIMHAVQGGVNFDFFKFEQAHENIKTYLKNLKSNLEILYMFRKSVLAEADRVQRKYSFKGKEKADAIRIALNRVWQEIYPKMFEEDNRIEQEQLNDLLLNTENDDGLSVKKALERDCNPKIIAKVGRWLFNKQSTTSYDNVINPKDSDHSEDKNFNP